MSCLKYKLLTPEYVIILSSSTFFFYFNYVPEDLLCEIAILTDDTALNKIHPVTKNLTCYDKLKQPLNCNLIFQIKIFLICKFTIFFLTAFFLYILWTIIDELSRWQCLILCLISSQERVSRNKLSLIFNTKLTSKMNKLKTTFI